MTEDRGTVVKTQTNSEGAYNEGYNYSNVFIRTNSERIGLVSDTSLGVLTLDAYRNEERYSNQPNYGHYRGQVYVLQGSDDLILSPSSSLRLHAEYRSDQLDFTPGGDTSYDIYAGSAMWNWQISDRLSWVNSGRIDYLKLHYDGPIARFSGLSLADYADRSITGFSFNSGLVYRASDADTLRLTFGRGLQMPSLYDLGIQQIFPRQYYGLIGNPALDPTAVLNVGLDYERDLPGLSSKLGLSVFAQRSDDLYVEPSSAPHTPVDHGYYWYYFAAQAGYGMAAGTEISLKGGLKSGLHWSASYSFVTTPDHSGVNYQSRESYVDFSHSTHLAIGFVVAGIVSFIVVRWLIRYVATHDFKPFAWYRIAFGAVVLLTAHFGWVDWKN